jgi:prophage tail gpP-like protein
MAFKQREKAEITVNGMVYRDWESVLVRDEEMASSDFFKFTCSEGMPGAKNWAAVRIRPGDHCTIMLAGQLAITGFVETRQVAYTGTAHGIEISGHSYTRALSYGAAQTKTGTGEFKNKSYQQIADEVTKPFGIKFKPIGNVSAKPFERVHIPPGQTAWEFLETLARQRNIVLGSDTEGNLTGRMIWMPGGDALIEGVNILEGREVMSINGGGANGGEGGDDLAHKHNFGQSQQSGTDERWGHKSAQAPFNRSSNNTLKQMGGTKGVYAPKRTLAEMPADQQDLQMRAQMEGQRAGMEQLEVTIVVQGWLRPSGGLWKAGDKAHVKAPMLIVDEELKITKVEFTQDDKSGTRTTIELARDTGEGDQEGDDGKHPKDYTPQSDAPQGGDPNLPPQSSPA